MGEVVVGLGDATVRVAPGDVVVVRLPEASTAGYQWRVAVIDPARLAVESASLVPGGAAPGAAGTREFRLRARMPGQVRVDFELSRGWESGPQQRHVLAVTVA